VAELRCEAVTAAYGERAVLGGVDLVVPEGTLTAILGASGSGKTTLLRVIMGFLRAERGRVLVGGTVVAEGGGVHLPPEKRAVGYVAQEGALYPHLRVGQNVAFGLPRAERKDSARIGEMLELVGLPADYAGRRAHELSGGEQRRVALARALAPRPRLVLLDEPFSGLDASLRAETREAVLRALADAKTTAVLVTHDQAEALSMGREVAVLRAGSLVQTSAPTTLYRTPADLDVARFVGEAVVLPGDARAGHVRCALGDLALVDPAVAGIVHTVIRPEQIRLGRTDGAQGPDRAGHIEPAEPGGPAEPSGPAGPAGAPARAGRVLSRTYYGPDVLLHVDLNGHVIAARSFSHDAPDVGDLVTLDVSGPVVAFPVQPGDPLAPES